MATLLHARDCRSIAANTDLQSLASDCQTIFLSDSRMGQFRLSYLLKEVDIKEEVSSI